MKEIFTLLAILESILLIIWLLVVAFKKRTRSSKSLVGVSAGVLAILLSYLGLSYNPILKPALVLTSIYFFSMDWILIFMTLNIIRLPYSGKDNTTEFKVLNFIVILAIIDSASCILNFAFNHLVEITPVYNKTGQIYTWYFFFKSAYFFHAVFCYFQCCTFIVLGILRISKFPPIYQNKYYLLLFVF